MAEDATSLLSNDRGAATAKQRGARVRVATMRPDQTNGHLASRRVSREDPGLFFCSSYKGGRNSSETAIAK